MTHEEAADALEGMATKELRFAHSGRLLKNENGSLMAECCEATAALLQYAARVLRSVASASADAEKGFDDIWRTLTTEGGIPEFPDDSYISKQGCRRIYLAGHAARQAEVDALRADLDAVCGECERLTRGMPAFILDYRQPRVTEILAARKSAPPQQEG